MLTSDFNYALPDALIAQEPPAERGTSRMMVVHRREARFEHRCVTDLPEYLNPNDLLVVNDTKVFPARLNGVWQDTGGAVELLLTDPLAEGDWACISGSGRPVRAGLRAVFGQGAVVAEILEKTGEGTCRVRFHSDVPLMEALEAIGKVPVPPYIHRTGDLRQHALDKERYQTIYARETGAVAAPTAGLHFTEALFGTLAAKGIARTAVTLHVGPGTFKPVKCATVEAHQMDAERYTVSAATAAAVAQCKARGGRVVAVGSTSVRTLETVAAAHQGAVVATSGASSIFIYPPYTFQVTDAMLTNFHLPQSTLIMMVSALAGRELILAAYAEAIKERYRFFSYGDCMLIL